MTKRYVVVENLTNSIIQILFKLPEFIPTDCYLVEYDGPGENEFLEVVDGKVVYNPRDNSLQEQQDELVVQIEQLINGKIPLSEIYREKIFEAVEYFALNEPEDLSTFPFLSMEASVRNVPVLDVAKSIVERRTEWIKNAVSIEYVRLQINNLKNNKIKSKAELDRISDLIISELAKTTIL